MTTTALRNPHPTLHPPDRAADGCAIDQEWPDLSHEYRPSECPHANSIGCWGEEFVGMLILVLRRAAIPSIKSP